jgi:hypothetical protein
MVDKKLKFISKNDKYGVVENAFSNRLNSIGKIVYSNGEPLKYGDKAEIFGILNLEEEFFPFMNSAISETYFSQEHSSVAFGYQHADYENKEIKENEVRIYYIEVENTITKKEFYELCLLLCDAKLKSPNKIGITNEELTLIKSQLEEKIKFYSSFPATSLNQAM